KSTPPLRVPRPAVEPGSREARRAREANTRQGYTRVVDEPLWRPTEERAAATSMDGFRRFLEISRGLSLPDYDALHDWSVAQPSAFWGDLADWLKLPFASRPERVISDDPMPRTRWFEGATLSYARAMLRPPGVDRDATAVI